MPKPLLLACAILSAAAATTHASTVRFQAELVGGANLASGVVTLRLTPQKGSEASRMALLSVPGEAMVELPEGETWQVLVESQELWSAPQWIAPSAGGTELVAVRLFPAATFEGVLKAPERQSPDSTDLRLEASPGAPSPKPPTTSLQCPVHQGRFRCTVPAGRLDLRLRAATFIPIYLWDVQVRNGEVKDLGSFELKAGASVVGWVRTEDAKAVAGARIRLEPEAFGIPSDISQARALKAMALEARTNDRGFFQVEDAGPGMTVVSVDTEGFAKLSRAGIEVRPGLESQILDPLVLTKPLTFHLTLQPPVNSMGIPWAVILTRMSEVEGLPSDEVYRGQVNPVGVWEQQGLRPGKYRISAREGMEPRLLEDVELLPGGTDFFFSLSGVQVRGRILLGDEPLKAVLWFGGKSAPLRGSFVSDEDGRFEGLLAKEGTWDVELVSHEHDLQLRLDPVEVEKPPGKSYATVEIRVPDTHLSGQVVDEQGEPVPDALVRVEPPRKQTSRKKTDSNGKFEFRGLPPGALLVLAEEGDRESDWLQARVDEDQESPSLRLVVRGRIVVQGRVFSRQGPVPGARVTGVGDLGEVGRASGDEAVTGPAGEFKLKLPSTTRLMHLTVLAPGHATRIMTAFVGPDLVLEIPLEPVGGTLVFDLGTWTMMDILRSGGGLLAHGGSFVPLGAAFRWTQLQHTPQSNPHRFVLPNMEPGEYLVCIGGGAFAAVPKGQEPPAGQCSAGYLNPLQELVLTIPPLPKEHLERLRNVRATG